MAKAQPVTDIFNPDRETMVSIILGAIVVIVVGALAFRYFRNQPNELANQEIVSTPSPALIEVTQLPEQIELEENENGEQVPSQLPARYTVQPGDSSWKVAQAFYGSGFNYLDIEQANNLESEQNLVAGMELVIPQVPVRNADQAGTPREVTTTEMGLDDTSATTSTGSAKGDDSAAEEMLTE